jgi:L-ascorbate metabolism protein UlaG (beta-lactamase superfamily)
MKLYIKTFFLSAAIAAISFISSAQDKTKPLWGDTSAFLNTQTELALQLIDSALNTIPPITGEHIVRKLALYNMDAILHEKRYDKSPALLQFMDRRVKAALEDMKRPLKKGMKIYKLYNHGFIVRTNTVTLAFDLFRGKGLIADSLMQAVVDQADILFISHVHGDHADRQVADMFLKAGKPVWAPTNVWESDMAIKHIRSETAVTERIELKGQKVSVQVYPGHQGNLMNNIYMVTTPEGFIVAQTGDQSQKKDMEWIGKLKDQPNRLDVLLVNCWTFNLPAAVDGFNPRLVVTGHENEMGHSIDHREPYWLSFLKLKQISKPYILMTWGERYLYKR